MSDIADDLIARYPALVAVREPLLEAAEMLLTCYHASGLIMTCGNGGSAADSAHIVAELRKGFLSMRPLTAEETARFASLSAEDQALYARLQRGIRAVNLAEASGINTAVANDQGADLVFAQSAFALGKPGDVLIGISTSGNSANVVHAMQVARAQGILTNGLTGEAPCRMDALCDCQMRAPATETFLIQEYHLPIYHALCAIVERRLFS
jgi:D-sedoheptulose 7-phosphate isomerase